MKTAPEFDQVVGQSHRVDTKVELRAPDDTVVGVLPVESGTVTGDATRGVARWGGDLTLAGLEWAPDGVDHPLAGLTGHYCSIQRAALPYGSAATWVEVARLWVYATEVTMSRSEASLRVRLVSPAGLLERTEARFIPNAGETCQQLIGRALNGHLPYTATVLDSSSPVPLPADWEKRWEPALSTVDTLVAVADARAYFDALGRLVIRPTLPSLDVATLAPVRQIAVDVDVIRYTLTFGRDIFSNDVRVTYSWEDSSGASQELDATASISSGGLRRDGPAGRLSTVLSVDQQARQSEANKFAEAVLTSQSQAWVTSRIDAVQDPRIEPDDIVETTYMDRTLRHRVVGVQFDLRTDAMQLTGRTSLGGP